jgi:hypothetical protein
LSENQDKDQNSIITSGGWSETGFSFVTAFSVALIISHITGPHGFPDFRIMFPSLVLSSLFSVFYFIKCRAELMSSAGSRKRIELLAYLLFIGLSALVLTISSAELILTASAAGIILVMIIDQQHSPRGNKIIPLFHSGQNLLTVLIIASFFSGLKWPFIFIALVKLISGIYYGFNDKSGNLYFSLRILRIALLIAAGISLITEISYSDPVITVMFLCGELIDRINYYHDLENKYKLL